MAQMTDHGLDPVKGWPHPAAMDYPVAGVDTGVAYSMRAGQVAHENTSGLLEPGVANHQMPLFLFQGVDSLDVRQQGDDQFEPVTPSGTMMCIPGKAAVELCSTEFYASLTYSRGDLLRAPTGNLSSNGFDAAGAITNTTSGVLRNDTITLFTTAVVAKVSRGQQINHFDREVLYFWPLYCPGTA